MEYYPLYGKVLLLHEVYGWKDLRHNLPKAYDAAIK